MRKKENDKKENESRLKNVGNWAHGFYVLCVIFRVFLIIGLASVAVCLFFVPSLTKNIEFKDNEIKAFGESIKYEAKDVDFIKITIGGKDYNINSKKVFKGIDKVLNNKNRDKISTVIMATLVNSMIIMVITIVILLKIEKLLKGVREEERVFLRDGNKVIMSIFFLYLARYVVQLVGVVINMAILGAKSYSISFDFTFIVTLLIIYFISIIYSYGESLEDR